jgi:hypothetical protein
MKKLLTVLCLFPLLIFGQSQKISQMAPASLPLTTAELVPLVQNGVNVATPIVNLPGTALTSPDGSIILSNPAGTPINLSVSSALYGGALNVVPGLYTFATLPSAATNAFKYASTSDQGAVFSNGASWQILYNPTSGTLRISSGTPLPGGQNGTAYSTQLTATNAVGAVTWSKVSQYAVTGTANTFTVSTSGVLADATEANNSTTAIVIQAVDSTGAIAQETVTVTVVASLNPAATPTFSPVAGTYASAQTVTIADATSSPTIYYTVNGSAPTTSSSVYSTPLTVSSTSTLKAIATASGYSQSAVGSAAYTIAATAANPIGINLAAGGSASFSYEGFPIFQDHFREGRWNSGTQALDTNGWPTTDWGVTLHEGHITQTWMQLGTGNFSCGFTSKNAGAETIASTGGTTVSGQSYNSGTGVVSFKVMMTATVAGFGVTNTNGGSTDIFCYLPAYPGTAYSATSLFTNEAIAHYKQYSHIRSMWAQNVWYNLGDPFAFSSTLVAGSTSGTLVGYNRGAQTATAIFKATTAGATLDTRTVTVTSGGGVSWSGPTVNAATTLFFANTSASRHTAANTHTKNGWAGGGLSYEGYPAEWFADLAIACNTGLWLNVPIFTDSTYLSSIASVLATKYAAYPTLQIYVEPGNENWNNGPYFGGSAAALNALSVFNGYSTPLQMAYIHHAVAGAFRTAFGSTLYGAQINPVAAWQTGSNGVNYFYNLFAGYATEGWTPSADLKYIAVAPYMVMSSPVSSWTVAQIEANLTTVGSSQPATSGVENETVMALHYGQGTIEQASYEGGWATGSESTTITNIGASIMDSGMTAVMQNYYNAEFNSGIVKFTQFESGVSSLSEGANDPVYELSNSFSGLTSGGATSPRFAAIQNYSGGLPTLTRNLVTGSGWSIPGADYADHSGTNPTLGIASFTLAPFYHTSGYVDYVIECYVSCPGSYTLYAYLTTTSSGYTDVWVNGTKTASAVSISSGLSNQAVNLGSITLQQGPNAVVLGNGTSQGSITVNALQDH